MQENWITGEDNGFVAQPKLECLPVLVHAFPEIVQQPVLSFSPLRFKSKLNVLGKSVGTLHPENLSDEKFGQAVGPNFLHTMTN